MVLEDAGIRADGPPAAVGTVSSVPARSWTARRRPPRETPALSGCPLSWRVFWPPARRLSRGHVPGWETVLASVCGLRDDMWAAPHGRTANKQRLAVAGSEK